MRYEFGGPLFELSQMLDITYSTDHEDYDDIWQALESWVDAASVSEREAVRHDIAHLRGVSPDPEVWLAAFDFNLPFTNGAEFATVLSALDCAAETALRAPDNRGKENTLP